MESRCKPGAEFENATKVFFAVMEFILEKISTGVFILIQLGWEK